MKKKNALFTAILSAVILLGGATFVCMADDYEKENRNLIPIGPIRCYNDNDMIPHDTTQTYYICNSGTISCTPTKAKVPSSNAQEHDCHELR